MEFKDRLKALRQERHLTQQQLADAVFVSRSAIAKWENGLGIPSEESYRALLTFFEIGEGELPLSCEVEEVSVSKNRTIRKLSRTVTLLCAISVILAVTVSLVLISVFREEGYDWNGVDLLLAELGQEGNTYFPDGSLALRGDMIEIYYHKDGSSETFVRLKKIYRDHDSYYKLIFERHRSDLVEGKIVSYGYSCSYHYEDMRYEVRLADVNYFIGNAETYEAMRQCATYQVNGLVVRDGREVSFSLEEISQFGQGIDHEFHLPGGDLAYIEEIMTFGFDKTTVFFQEHGLDTPY